MAAGYEMRVSDAEREAAVAELREHFASGRLNQDELDDRLTAAFAAKTRADLSALFTDLPSGGPGWSGASTQGGPRAGAGAFGSVPFGSGSLRTGPYGAGPFGPDGGRWAPPGGPDADGSWQGRGTGSRTTAGGMIGRVVLNSVLIWVLFILGILGVFGVFGTGRPIGVILIVAAFALLRRLVFVLIGRRRGRGSGRRGPRGRR